MPHAADDRITAEALGARLRAARIAQGASLRMVATALGVSPSLISLVETGKTQPSIGTLTALVEHLGLSFDDLLAEQRSVARSPRLRIAPAVSVQRRGQGAVIETGDGVHWERLSRLGESSVDPYLVTFDPGAATTPGTGAALPIGRMLVRATEYAYLLAGELTVHVGAQSGVLRAGDALNVDSTAPHRYVNHGAVPARGLWYLVSREQRGQRGQ